MSSRVKISIILLSLGLILALLPLSSDVSFTARPDKLLSEVLDSSTFISVDQVSGFLVSEDSTVQIIDLRPAAEYRKMNIPGSLNIPYEGILDKDPWYFLNTPKAMTIFYSNGDLEANYALSVAKGLGFKNIYVMKGGLNEWYRTVMNSRFTGERISARENALFETRKKARELFTGINSLPDSLKAKYAKAVVFSERKLDGGCE